MLHRALYGLSRSIASQLCIQRTTYTCNFMSSIAQIPPEKKARVHSPPRKVVFSSALNGDAEASRKSHDKLQAKRIKAKVRDRQRKIAKTGEEPIFFDICDLLGKDKVAKTRSQGPLAEWEDKFPKGLQLEIQIQTLSAHGEGLGIAPSQDWVISVPNCLPGETVLARIYTNERLYSKADLIRVIQGAAEGSQSVQRQDELVKCRYFGKCSGCQYQFLKYDDQLEHKRNVVRRAFQNYAEGLNSSDIPAVLPTLPSPQHYKYRTKLTPHFELPREIRQRRKNKEEKMNSPLPPVSIGFDKLDEKTILDIEECVIATETINRALPGERSRIQSSIDTYKNGATILLRDSLRSFHDEESDVITDHKASVRERVGLTKFTSPAGAFFQNNRSILPALVEYVQEQIEMFALHPSRGKDSFLVDAYCGSGLFSLCLAHLFTRVAGVEISQDSIRFAKENAALNEVDNVDFLAGDAMEIFKHITFPSEQTTVIIDPPRRGCDENFIQQLLALRPKLIVYVSCNVHTQARDVSQIVRGTANNSAENHYSVLSLRGADLFPQTYHVEGICILQRTH